MPCQRGGDIVAVRHDAYALVPPLAVDAVEAGVDVRGRWSGLVVEVLGGRLLAIPATEATTTSVGVKR